MERFGEQFLHSKNPDLHTSGPVEHEKARKTRKGEETSEKPADKIADWLKVLERTHIGHEDDPRVLERIKDYYHREYVIKPEAIPESAFLLEQRIAEQLGHGKIEITDEFRQQKTDQIISDQQHSLDRWLEYLSSPDAKYPIWAKYWAFKSMVKMGKLEKYEDVEIRDGVKTKSEKSRFGNRDKRTIASFPPMNPNALAKTFSAIEARARETSKQKKDRSPVPNQSTQLNDEAFQKLLNAENFSKLYTQFLIEIPEYSSEGLRETRGMWKVYKKGSSPDELVASLDGYPLEWCTANKDTARSQLQGGDFYVYYSINQDNNPVIPRVAIRMEGDSIAEVRGIAPDQNMDPYISDVVKTKMAEFPDGQAYEKKSADMKRMTEIHEKHSLGQELTKEDLRFLYELDFSIDGFGYQKDPRIQEILQTRDIIADLSFVTGFLPEQISLTGLQALEGQSKFHYGNLDLNGLTSAEGLKLPENISGNLDLMSLTSAEGLKLPENIGGTLRLDSLGSAEGLRLPETIGEDLYLDSLGSTEGLNLPENISGNLDLRSLTSAEGLQLPETIGGYLYLNGLTSAEGLKLPETIGGSLDLNGLTSVEGLKLPETIGGNLRLDSLGSAEGLKLPETIGGGLYLNNLTSAEGLHLPDKISGDLNLNGLTSVEGLQLPETISEDLYLNGLTSAEGLKLPETIGGRLYLNGLSSGERYVFNQEYPGIKIYNAW